ncbi:MAG: DNA repair protein RecO [Desulfobulbaceae bacterium]|nr:DNA repair protein RecO [Desulfobulbaceae bacterium]
MALQRTAGVVIHLTDYGEADKIVTLYSPTLGQWTGIAKGAKRSIKRFVNKLELFSHLDIDYSDQYALPIINQAELINSHLALRQNYQNYTAATLVCELFRSWTHANDHDPQLFSCLIWILERLCQHHAWQEAMVLFLIKFYSRLGYQPNLLVCATCQRLENHSGPFRFQASHGEIVCRKCQSATSAVMLSINTVKLLSKALVLPLDKLNRLRFTPSSTNEALALFKHYDRYLLDREGPSWNFIKT